MSARPICLVQPPASFSNRSPCLDDKQYGLGLLALASWLEKNGFETFGLHVPLSLRSGLTDEDVCRSIIDKNPLLVAIGLNWVHFSDGAIEIARMVKRRLPNCPVFLGGQHASLFASEIAIKNRDCIDGVIKGEAEIPLLQLARAVASEGRVVGTIPGLVQGDGSSVEAAVVQQIDDLPVYSYSSLNPPPLQPDVGALSTARGACPFNCSWCVEPVVGRLQGRKKLQFHSSKHIVDQIEGLLAEGIDRFTIQDNFFVGGDKKLVALSEELVRRGIRPRHINVFAHPDSFGPRGLKALAACCEKASIDYGVETGSVRVANINNRKLEPDKVVEQIEAAVDAGVEPYTWWMVGLPGEDSTALAETENLILRTMKAGGVPRWVSPLILFPKTPIHEEPDRFGVKARFKGFEDYAAFSRTTLTEAVLFSDVMTHETREATIEGIVEASQRLRRFIVGHLYLLKNFYADHRLQPDLGSVQSRVLQSFF